MAGYLRKRGDSWLVIVSGGRDPVTGRRRHVSRTVHGTKRDAEAVLAQLLVDVGRGRHLGTDATVAELLGFTTPAAGPSRRRARRERRRRTGRRAR